MRKIKPMSNALAQSVIPAETSSVPASAGRLTSVGVVEDNPGLRRSFTRLIEHAPGLRCVGAWADGKSALIDLPAFKPDVVLMDINMPGMSGIECTAQLKQLCPATQVIMVTVYADSENVFQALQAGACGYLLKRTASSEILQAINQVRSGGAPMTNEIARKVVHAFRRASAPTGPQVELTQREREILELVSQGFVDKDIACQLDISYHTVKVHVKHIYEKLHVHSRFEVMSKYGQGQGVPRMSQAAPMPAEAKLP